MRVRNDSESDGLVTRTLRQAYRRNGIIRVERRNSGSAPLFYSAGESRCTERVFCTAKVRQTAVMPHDTSG